MAQTVREDKITVLIADDHTMVREGMRHILEGQHDIVVVDEAANGAEAVERTLSSQPMVVLMDLQMPVMNGLEATKRIKAALPETAVLVLTAYDNDPYVLAILEAGAAGYLLKTVRSSELVSAIRTVRAGESVLHPSVAHKVVTRLAQKAQPQVPNLTDRELEVLRCAAAGASNKQIASMLGVTRRTVQAHLSNVFSKMQVASRVEAIIKGIQVGLLQMPIDHPTSRSIGHQTEVSLYRWRWQARPIIGYSQAREGRYADLPVLKRRSWGHAAVLRGPGQHAPKSLRAAHLLHDTSISTVSTVPAAHKSQPVTCC